MKENIDHKNNVISTITNYKTVKKEWKNATLLKRAKYSAFLMVEFQDDLCRV